MNQEKKKKNKKKTVFHNLPGRAPATGAGEELKNAQITSSLRVVNTDFLTFSLKLLWGSV